MGREGDAYLQGCLALFHQALDQVVLGFCQQLLDLPAALGQGDCPVTQVVEYRTKVLPTAVNQDPACKEERGRLPGTPCREDQGPLQARPPRGNVPRVHGAALGPSNSQGACQEDLGGFEPLHPPGACLEDLWRLPPRPGECAERTWGALGPSTPWGVQDYREGHWQRAD